MPKLMEKRDWIQTVANIGVADRVWSENISTNDGKLSMPTLEAGNYQIIFVKIDAMKPSPPPARKSARDFIGWGLQFDSKPCSTDEWMKELREGEND